MGIGFLKWLSLGKGCVREVIICKIISLGMVGILFAIYS
jgi:hypothetical protein